MAKLSLSDGWYPIQGDGRQGDPDRRNCGYYTNRRFHFAYVQNGKVIGVWGHTNDPDGWQRLHECSPNHRTYKTNCEIAWGAAIANLIVYTQLEKPDEWAGDFELETGEK